MNWSSTPRQWLAQRMSLPLAPTAALFGWPLVARRPADVQPSPVPLCLTPGAALRLYTVLATVPPEAGCTLLGPWDRLGVDHVEYDKTGSGAATTTAFPIDRDWVNRRMKHWLDRDDPMRVLTGIAHSHPNHHGHLSAALPDGSGDLAWAEAFFARNPLVATLALPIVTGGTDKGDIPRLHPWMLLRDRPSEPLWAEVSIATAAAFPSRPWNGTSRTVDTSSVPARQM